MHRREGTAACYYNIRDLILEIAMKQQLWGYNIKNAKCISSVDGAGISSGDKGRLATSLRPSCLHAHKAVEFCARIWGRICP